MEDGTETIVDHGHVVIAAITSCTNTSNPQVMIGAALLAKKAVERGLTSKPWVKTTLAPGSKVVMDYYEKAELTPYLEKLGFYLVGYGCTTCIGNSGPLPEPVSAAVNEADLAVVSVLSGNRNFEGRINPDVKMNYLASPPLVIAYALAGSMDVDLNNDPLGQDTDGNDVFLHDIWPSPQEVQRVIDHAVSAEMFSKDYADVFAGTEQWQNLPTPDRRHVRVGPARAPTSGKPPYFDGMPAEPAPVEDISGARTLAVLGDSVTTDHISPAGSIKADSPAGKYLREHGVDRRDFNSYGSRRGNHEVMIRGTFANIRLRNQLVPGTEGGVTKNHLTGETTSIYEASRAYIDAGIPLVVLAGKEYGSGSSRDWAAKGTALLGVKAVIAESYERIHRSNLIGMGVLPLQYPEGQNRESLGLTGDEEFTITGITALNDGGTPAHGQGQGRGRRVRRPRPHRHPRRGELLPQRRDHAVRAALAAGLRRLMDLGLGGRGYLLTGASRGLGFATARALVDDGARVLVSSRSRRRRRRGRRGARRRTGGVRLAGRPGRPGRRRAAGRRGPRAARPGRRRADQRRRPGAGHRAGVHRGRLAGRRRLRAARHAAAGQGAGPAPGRRRRDRLVLSTSVREPIGHLAISNGLRPGLAMTAKALADELGPRGIRVFGLLPGTIATDRITEIEAAHRRPGGRAGRTEAGIPLRRSAGRRSSAGWPPSRSPPPPPT